MIASRKSLLGFSAAMALAAMAAGCGSVGDIESGAKAALVGKPAPIPDLPDRPKLSMPAPNAPLPVPGEAAPAQPQWSTAAQQQSNQQSNQQADATPKQEQSGGWFSGLFGSRTQ